MHHTAHPDPSLRIILDYTFSSCRGIYENGAEALDRAREMRDGNPPQQGLEASTWPHAYTFGDIEGNDSLGIYVGKEYQYVDQACFLQHLWVRGCVLERGVEESELLIDYKEGQKWMEGHSGLNFEE